MVTITISGSPGSGKTTIAKLLAKKLGIKYVYSGDIFRKKAKEYNPQAKGDDSEAVERREYYENGNDHVPP